MRLICSALAVAVCFAANVALAQGFDPAKIPGVVVDDVDAEKTGNWTESQYVKPFVNKHYIHATGENQQVQFTLNVPEDGDYEVFISYTHGTNRSPNAKVVVHAQNGPQEFRVDQRKPPAAFASFHSLGTHAFQAGEAAIVISTEGTSAVVIADAVALLTSQQLELVKKDKNLAVLAAAEAANPAPPPPPKLPPPVFKRQQPKRAAESLTSRQLDDLLAQHVEGIENQPLQNDTQFLTRVTLDFLGRPPAPEELAAFLANESEDRRAREIDRLLESPELGVNWSNYWVDVMAARMQEPELTFHNYQPLKNWLAEQFNQGAGWDEVVFDMLTAEGKVGETPQATFVAFHQGSPEKLAGEASRVFLAMKIHCAECHDHPFIDMPQASFHGMAAFFARTEAKIAQFDSNQIEIKSKDKGEHKIPGQKEEIAPTLLSGDAHDLGAADLQRRAALAEWVVSGDNPWFAKAYVNRVWARLIGRGFSEPVDDIGEGAAIYHEELFTAVAGHFIAARHDPRDLLRLIANTNAYQRQLVNLPPGRQPAFSSPLPKKLRGDEVFASLQTAIALPNVTPPREKKTGDIRFPPPAKSTQDVVAETFNYDPSFRDEDIIRTMGQAMFLMNNEQVQQQINADPASETMLAKLLAKETDDPAAVKQLYTVLLARAPTEKELELCLGHLKSVEGRGQGFEDILWSLVNSAEFTTRR